MKIIIVHKNEVQNIILKKITIMIKMLSLLLATVITVIMIIIIDVTGRNLNGT